MEATDVPSISTADLLEQGSKRIVDRYEAILWSRESRLLQDPETRNECLQQARFIIADICSQLRGLPHRGPGGGNSQSLEIGASRAGSGIHPSESLGAAVSLFEAVMETATAMIERITVPPEEMLELALISNRVISHRIRLAASTYVGFLLESLEKTHVDERKRMSRELHDRIGGNLATAHHQLDLFQVMRDDGDAQADICLERIGDALRRSLQDLRDLIGDLRSWEPIGGLQKALLNYVATTCGDGLRSKLSVNGDEDSLPPQIRNEVFLIIREAIRNTERHARAGSLLVQVNIMPTELYAVVEDNGVGLNLDREESSACDNGLTSMRERAALLDGDIVITSQKGRGTRVELFMPLLVGRGARR